MTAVSPHPVRRATGSRLGSRWWILTVLGISQLMIVVDGSIVNIALPTAQQALHISTADRQWIITAYSLTFGGLLLLGGRVADYMGRKRVLIVGLLGFAGASALGGLAGSAATLFAARALQGCFAALMAPAAMSLMTVTFTRARERALAFGVWGAIAGGGLAMGLILGGVITEFASWRWCLLVNTPIALLAAVAAVRIIPESRVPGHTRYDIPGAVTSTLGMVTLVYAATKASTDGWGSSSTLALFAVATVLLVAFVVIEQFSTHPLLPLRVVTERNRGGSYLATFLLGVGLFGSFLFLTYYMQETLHYSALKTGLAFLPFSAGIVAGALVSSRLILRIRPRFIMSTGIVLAILAVLRFSQLGVNSEYWAHLFPALLLMAFGMGMVFVPANNTALNGIASADAGVASALINATPQVAVSIGTAVTNTIAATVTANYLRTHSGGRDLIAEATVHGFSVAFLVGAAVLVLALATVLVFITAPAGAGAREFSSADEDSGDRPAEGHAPSTLVPTPAST